jgi:hypothetical protein
LSAQEWTERLALERQLGTGRLRIEIVFASLRDSLFTKGAGFCFRIDFFVLWLDERVAVMFHRSCKKLQKKIHEELERRMQSKTWFFVDG